MFGIFKKKSIAPQATGKRAGRVLTAASIVAATIAAPFTAHHEGLRLSAYLDPVGIPTICYGETQNVSIGDVKTKAECDAMFEARLGWFAYMVDLKIEPEIPAKTHAALASFTYNIGVGAFNNSTVARRFNEGNFEGGCDAMLMWKRAGGKDCSIRSNGCYGLWTRRKAEHQLCHEGLEDNDI